MAVQTQSSKPTLSAVGSGAVSGVILFVVLILIDHFVFASRETGRYGLTASLISAAVMGIVFGAIVGLVVALTRSMPAGIVAGAILFALAKVLVLGTTGAMTAFAIVFGLIYGALFGWGVAASAMKALDPIDSRSSGMRHR